MKNLFKLYLYDWHGLNQTLSQKLHLLIQNKTTLTTLRFFTEYIGYYKMFPIHLIIIFLIMLMNLFLHKNKMSKDQLSTKTKTYFHLLSTLVVTVICMAAAVGAAKEIFTLTRPLCMRDFILSEYATEYRNFLDTIENLSHECTISFPSGHSSYVTVMLVILWNWLLKPFRLLGILVLIAVLLSRIALGMHFLADIFFAVLMSAFIALAVKHMMKKFFEKRERKLR